MAKRPATRADVAALEAARKVRVVEWIACKRKTRINVVRLADGIPITLTLVRDARDA